MFDWRHCALLIVLAALAQQAVALPTECDNWNALQPDWIWCDDFESDPKLNIDYFEVNRAGGRFGVSTDAAYGGNASLKGVFIPSSSNAGNIKFSFGRTPVSPTRYLSQDFQNIYWRFYMMVDSTWVGNPQKTTRITVFSESDWSQAVIGHLWGDGSLGQLLDPASGTDPDPASTQVLTSGYNDFVNLRWLGILRGSTQVYSPAYRNRWVCVETHIKLNTPGLLDGIFEYWIDDALEVNNNSLNWRSSYQDYGLNAIFIENWHNTGVSQQQARFFDNFVVSTSRIGCYSEPPPPRCDLNGNGRVDAGDNLQVLRMVFGNIPDSLECDLDNNGAGDGVITLSDYLIVTKIVLGIIPAI